jgi:hypothetical protein
MKYAGRIKIKDGHLIYLDDFKGMVEQIKADPKLQGKYAEISIEFKEQGVKYFRHKYYRGYLLPDIANAAYDGRIRKAHIELKRMFLYTLISDVYEIPEKHYPGVIIDFRESRMADGEIKTNPVGYLPSTGKLTDKEMKQFIMKVENFAFSDLHIDYKEGSAGAVARSEAYHEPEEILKPDEVFENKNTNI